MQEWQSHFCAWETEIFVAFISSTKLNHIICNERLALVCVGIFCVVGFFLV